MLDVQCSGPRTSADHSLGEVETLEVARSPAVRGIARADDGQLWDCGPKIAAENLRRPRIVAALSSHQVTQPKEPAAFNTPSLVYDAAVAEEGADRAAQVFKLCLRLIGRSRRHEVAALP